LYQGTTFSRADTITLRIRASAPAKTAFSGAKAQVIQAPQYGTAESRALIQSISEMARSFELPVTKATARLRLKLETRNCLCDLVTNPGDPGHSMTFRPPVMLTTSLFASGCSPFARNRLRALLPKSE
jgi:hypothetical protein